MKFYFIIMFLICSVCYSQTDTAYNFLLPETLMLRKTDKKDIEIIFEEGYTVKVLQDTLKYHKGNINYSIGMDKVKRLSFYSGTNFWGGAGIGAAGGFIFGFLITGKFDLHSSSKPFNVGIGIVGGLLTAIPLGLIGGVFGSLSSIYEDYDLSNGSKREAILSAFRKNRLTNK